LGPMRMTLQNGPLSREKARQAVSMELQGHRGWNRARHWHLGLLVSLELPLWQKAGNKDTARELWVWHVHRQLPPEHLEAQAVDDSFPKMCPRATFQSFYLFCLSPVLLPYLSASSVGSTVKRFSSLCPHVP
jgi:hypothetical protein